MPSDVPLPHASKPRKRRREEGSTCLFGARHLARCQADAHLWDLRASDVARHASSWHTACSSEGIVRGWPPIPCKRSPRRSSTCYDHARACSARVFFWKDNMPTMVYRYPHRHNTAPDVGVWPHTIPSGPCMKHNTTSSHSNARTIPGSISEDLTVP